MGILTSNNDAYKETEAEWRMRKEELALHKKQEIKASYKKRSIGSLFWCTWFGIIWFPKVVYVARVSRGKPKYRYFYYGCLSTMQKVQNLFNDHYYTLMPRHSQEVVWKCWFLFRKKVYQYKVGLND